MAPTRRVLFWITLISGFLLLSIAAGLRAEAQDLSGSAARRQEFTASGALKSLSIENPNGNIRIVEGPAFKATVDLTARAATGREARKILDETECRFSNENGELELVVGPPGVKVHRPRRGGRAAEWDFEPGAKVDARVDIALPSGVPVDVSTVNGDVSVRGIVAAQKLSTVNGKIEVAGATQGLKLHTINGSVSATVAGLPKGADLELKSVSGNLTLTLPASAAFRFEGKTMSGSIVSTFALPERKEPASSVRAESEKLAAEKAKIAAEKTRIAAQKAKLRETARDKAFSDDLTELDRSLDEMSRELGRMGAEIARAVSLNVSLNLNRSYEGTVGGGGALVRMSNLNGRIALLAAGTTETQAKPLVPVRHARVVEIPEIPEIPPIPAIPPVPPMPPGLPIPPEPPEFGRPVVRGNVSGDFVATDVTGDVTLGRVAGRVKVATQWGEIRVGAAGKGAELSSAGGEIAIDAVTGDLTATTMGGNIRAGSVSGDARLETSGGDIVLKSGGGAVMARTSAGDVTLRKIRGPVVARTSGGTVLCEIVSVERPGVEVVTGGGDVTLVLPANYRGDVDVHVSGVDAEGDYIVSQFPGLAVVKREGMQKAEGKLGGGGPRISVRTAAGVVLIRKGPPAS
jgi:DUF4097 and DUF4098 domain-containing protein YvlB